MEEIEGESTTPFLSQLQGAFFALLAKDAS
jgi:hypothetical protein